MSENRRLRFAAERERGRPAFSDDEFFVCRGRGVGRRDRNKAVASLRDGGAGQGKSHSRSYRARCGQNQVEDCMDRRHRHERRGDLQRPNLCGGGAERPQRPGNQVRRQSGLRPLYRVGRYRHGRQHLPFQESQYPGRLELRLDLEQFRLLPLLLGHEPRPGDARICQV